jgi:glucose/arabinose dehydrogenase
MIRFGIPWLMVIVLTATACTPDEATTGSSDPAVATTAGASATTTSTRDTAPETTEATVLTTVALAELKIELNEVESGFDHPVLLVADPDGGADYVVEQPGQIVRADGQEHAVALDIRDEVTFEGEQGLLGLAFHPDFADNHLAYVNYVDGDGSTVIAQFDVRSGVLVPASQKPVLRIEQPAGNHNGGMIAFGPEDHLWIGMGDGGNANDVSGHGQDPSTLLGSMLRIGVPGVDAEAYYIPEGNPFADGLGGAPEVYWTGLRNPWRFSIDQGGDANGDVWIADVGQASVEEVSVVHATESGANLGWSVVEGSECSQSDECDKDPFVLPVTEYGHEDGCSITGGYVYRGEALAELEGHFFYSDFCSGFIRSYSPQTGDHDWTPMTGSVSSVSGFGIGGDGELYVVSQGGSIFRLERAG